MDAEAQQVTAVIPVNFPSSGTGGWVTITGLSFDSGGIDSTPAAYAQNVGSSLGSLMTQCETTSWTSASSLMCSLVGVDTQGLNGDGLGIKLGPASAIVTTSSVAFTFDVPVVTFSAFSSSNAPSSFGAMLTISGVNFVSRNPSATVGLASTGGSAYTGLCVSVQWVAMTSLVCQRLQFPQLPTTSPRITGFSGSLLLSVGSIVGTGAAVAYTFDAPIATSVYVVNVPVSAAYTTLAGANFFSQDVTASVSAATVACATTAWTSASTVLCGRLYQTQSASTLNQVMYVTAQSQVGTGAAQASLTFDAPSASALSGVPFRNYAVSHLAVSITISGLNFGVPDTTASATFAGPTAAGTFSFSLTTSWTTATSVIVAPVQQPFSALTVAAMAITVGGVAGTSTPSFSFDAPFATTFTSVDTSLGNLPQSAGQRLTLEGLNFGAFETTATARALSYQYTTSWTSMTTVVVDATPDAGYGGGRAPRVLPSAARLDG